MAAAKKRVLIVDDNVFFLKQQMAYLNRESFDVHTATSGRETLEKAWSVNPHLIFLDQFIGDMTGEDVCRKLKSDPVTAHIPIIVVSSGEHESSRLQMSAAGCDGILFKPTHRNQFLCLVEEFLEISIRQWPRARVSLPCTITRESIKQEGTLHSLGGGGAFVMGSFSFLRGDTCRIRFSLPGPGPVTREVEVREALVVWLGNPDRNPQEGAGVKFLSIKHEDQEAIDRYVASLLESGDKIDSAKA